MITLFFVCFGTPSVEAAGQCGINSVVFHGLQSPNDDEFLYENKQTFEAVANNNKRTDLPGKVYECDDEYCEHRRVVYAPSGSVFKGASTTEAKVFVCSTFVEDKWLQFNIYKCPGNFDSGSSKNRRLDIEIQGRILFDVGNNQNNFCYMDSQNALNKTKSKTNTTNTSTNSTTANNTKNSSQKAQKNNESSNKPAASQQQAPVEEYKCDKEKLQQLAEWSTKYAANENISAAIKELEEYCNKQKDKNERTFTIKYNTLADMINEIEEENALQQQKEQEAAQQAENEKAKQQSRTKITSTIKILDDISGRFELSVWKDEDGNFNTARLVSDSVAGVVLGTAGGLITSNVVKKNQIKSGFEDIKCTIGGQVVADWGDQFRVGIR